MNLYKCGPEDLNQVISIGRETYYDTFQAMNSAETMQKYLDESFSRTKMEKELNNPDSSFYFLYDQGSLVGYIKINAAPSQTDINDKDSLELERIYVKNRFKGYGYGRFLIEQTFGIARERGCRYVWLGVWEKNTAAIDFYRKMGFVMVDQHPFRMGDEIQNDFVLKKSL